jgi:creatinine amidohydrolase
MNVHYEELKLDDIGAVIRERPIVYLAVGPMEAHGPHGPLGLDALKAHALCVRIAREYGGVAYPPLCVGQQACALSYAGNVYVRPETARVLYRDLLVCLERTGFQVIVLMAGHYPEAGLIKEVAVEFMVNGMTSVLALTEKEAAPEIMGGGDHGGKWETSLMLALRPELVDMGRLNPDRSVTPPAMLGTDARDASAAEGERAAALIVRRVGGLVTHLLEQRRRGTHHPALFTQFRQRELELEREAARRGRGSQYHGSPLLAQYREAFWAGEFERADALQAKLAEQVYAAGA